MRTGKSVERDLSQDKMSCEHVFESLYIKNNHKNPSQSTR